MLLKQHNRDCAGTVLWRLTRRSTSPPYRTDIQILMKENLQSRWDDDHIKAISDFLFKGR